MNRDEPLANVQQEDGRPVLRFERSLRHPPATVWRALTESEHLAAWLPCDIVGERHAGAAIELPFWPAHVERYEIDAPVLPGRILTWDPPRCFEWTWDTDVLRWELAPQSAGTLLRFTTWLEPGTEGTPQTAAGFHVCLDNLADLLDGGPLTPLVDVDVAPWEPRYGASLGG